MAMLKAYSWPLRSGIIPGRAVLELGLWEVGVGDMTMNLPLSPTVLRSVAATGNAWYPTAPGWDRTCPDPLTVSPAHGHLVEMLAMFEVFETSLQITSIRPDQLNFQRRALRTLIAKKT